MLCFFKKKINVENVYFLTKTQFYQEQFVFPLIPEPLGILFFFDNTEAIQSGEMPEFLFHIIKKRLHRPTDFAIKMCWLYRMMVLNKLALQRRKSSSINFEVNNCICQMVLKLIHYMSFFGTANSISNCSCPL